jgi:hypothetical protein
MICGQLLLMAERTCKILKERGFTSETALFGHMDLNMTGMARIYIAAALGD